MNRFLVAVEARIAAERDRSISVPGAELPHTGRDSVDIAEAPAPTGHRRTHEEVLALGRTAAAMRRDGLLWSVIGERLGVTPRHAAELAKTAAAHLDEEGA